MLLGASVLAGLYAVSRYDFLLFHRLVEAFTIIVAIAVFAIFWNTRRFLDNGIYLVLGLGCLFAGLLDLIYVFAYPGMSAFFAADANCAQAKTVAQWYVGLSCAGCPVHSPQDQPEGGVGDLRHHSGAGAGRHFLLAGLSGLLHRGRGIHLLPAIRPGD